MSTSHAHASTRTSLTALALGCLLAVGCAGSQPPPEAPASQAEASPLAERDMSLTPKTPVEGAADCSLNTVYFDFDAFALTERARNAIDTAVKCMRDNGAPAKIHLTGATDPRGTEEYNLALGEKRALAVEKYLVSLGVDAGRIATSSVGEEMATGEDEAGWAQDRKVLPEATEAPAATE